MNAVQDLESSPLDHRQELVGFGRSQTVEASSSTQQLLDELLGRLEDDGLSTLPPHSFTLEGFTDFEA
jgi:hypothetical protein